LVVSALSTLVAHSQEKEAFADYINNTLNKDKDIGARLPINPKDNSLFSSVHDGLLICKLINDAIPETIDERVLNKGASLNNFKIHENQAVAINSAKAIGCNIVNIGAQDLMDGAVRTTPACRATR
jgi:hypothetical protein